MKCSICTSDCRSLVTHYYVSHSNNVNILIFLENNLRCESSKYFKQHVTENNKIIGEIL